MKKAITLLLIVLVVVALSACDVEKINKGKDSIPSQIESKTQSVGQEVVSKEIISRDQAINTALTEAGLDINSVYDLDAEFDRERGRTVWEVDFETVEFEYSYEVDAYTGVATRVEVERD